MALELFTDFICFICWQLKRDHTMRSHIACLKGAKFKAVIWNYKFILNMALHHLTISEFVHCEHCCRKTAGQQFTEWSPSWCRLMAVKVTMTRWVTTCETSTGSELEWWNKNVLSKFYWRESTKSCLVVKFKTDLTDNYTKRMHLTTIYLSQNLQIPERFGPKAQLIDPRTQVSWSSPESRLNTEKQHLAVMPQTSGTNCQ